MESIDGRNLILPFPLRVERHSLSSIFVPFRRGGGKIFFSTFRLVATLRARSHVARTHSPYSPRRDPPPCLHASARPPTSRIDFPPRGGKFERQRIPTANMGPRFLGSKRWIREFCFIILLETRERFNLS